MYKIGILEDDESDILLIKVVINDYLKKEGISIEFKEYEIDNINTSDLHTVVIEKLIHDINDNEIQGIIIDQNMKTKYGSLSGSAIYQDIINLVREFPIIILTNYVPVAKKNKFLDSDKIYDKAEFLDKEKEIGKKNTEDFFRNIDRFYKIRDNLQKQLHSLQQEYITKGFNEEIVGKLISVEGKLSGYDIESDAGFINKQIDEMNFDKIMDLIERIDKFIDEE